MKNHHFIAAAAILAAVASCGGRTVIDDAKDAYLAECPAHDVGTIVNNFYNTTSWTAYNGDAEAMKKIYAEGEILFAGAYKTARLGFNYNESSGDITLIGVSFSGADQPIGIARALVERMCDEAG